MDRGTEKEREERIGRALLKLIPTELQKAAKTTLHYFEQQAFRYTDQSDLLHFCSLPDPTKKLQPIKSNISSQDYKEVKSGILSALRSYSSLLRSSAGWRKALVRMVARASITPWVRLFVLKRERMEIAIACLLHLLISPWIEIMSWR
jgi:hypothetical protein